MIDKFLDKTYSRKNYNCAHFAAEVWLSETRENLLPLLLPLMDRESPSVPRELGRLFKSQKEKPRRGVRAIVLMRRSGAASHVGIYLRGRILHIHERGVEFLPPAIASRGFESVVYYVRK